MQEQEPLPLPGNKSSRMRVNDEPRSGDNAVQVNGRYSEDGRCFNEHNSGPFSEKYCCCLYCLKKVLEGRIDGDFEF
jgi:hypothetical protein